MFRVKRWIYKVRPSVEKHKYMINAFDKSIRRKETKDVHTEY